MNRLITDRINEHSQYDVEYDDNLLVFTTEHGMRWFNGAEQQQLYVSRTVEIKGEGRTEYVALLAQRNHPDIDKILLRFDEEVAMFNSVKP